mmetsp:Transcript_33276/g.48925  ORF Transcript_33276/g.48925 Transcript_33276/m.48925 type:complete len:256 (+) Transcript_33276:106-873(+)|eukprot:CAMPEP_0195513486 /NCGR_PEP_ID=MMETSP0794_2-20130614/5131_1 /TAXON_ID=515487 /ORGANISM="Stephanopyxis turris, Strain CCMP 815" /LENGTH=255 /DNA_ID=CAMNT_0040641509 /DNA_START=103 /DNA_END=870 /DNA_ORIENTATION=-
MASKAIGKIGSFAFAVFAFLDKHPCNAFAPGNVVTAAWGKAPVTSAVFMSDGGLGQSLDPKETAIVLIEYQNEFTTEGGGLHNAVKECMVKTNMLENSSKLMNAMRDAGCLIVHLPISFEKGHEEISGAYGILSAVKEGGAFQRNSWASDFHQRMRPAHNDIVIRGKLGLCGFHSTNLDFILRQKGVKNVVLGGFLTNCCVESTMRTAYEHGYNVITLKDCTSATSVGGHEAAFEHNFGMFSTIGSSDDVIRALQ